MSTTPETTALTEYKKLGILPLIPEAVKNYINSKASTVEIALFIHQCKKYDIDPFSKEAHLIDRGQGYKFEPSKDYMLKVARRQPDCKGIHAGIIVLTKDGQVKNKIGACVLKKLGEELVGGWCKVNRAGFEPHYVEVTFDEYDAKQATWRKIPASMIRKVALSQAVRETYPEKFQGIYDKSEMDQAYSGSDDTELLEADLSVEDLGIPPSEIPELPDINDSNLLKNSLVSSKAKIDEMEELIDLKKENIDAKELIESVKGNVTSRTLTPENITDINPEIEQSKQKQLPRYPAPDDLETEAIDIDIFMGRLYELSGSPQFIIDSSKKLDNLPVLEQDSFVFLVREKKYCGWSFNAWPMDKKDENKKDMLTIAHPAGVKFPRISFRFDNGALVVADQTKRFYGDYALAYFLRATGFGVNWVIAPQRVYEAYKAEYR